MRSFHLLTSDFLNKDFELKAINLAFVFQVNCPGCFLYGVPQMNSLVSLYKGRLGFVGVATAFEDFDLNTEANTLALLTERKLVGATAYYFRKHGLNEVAPKIAFPVAFDRLVTGAEFVTASNLETLCQTNPNYLTWAGWERELLREKIRAHYVSQEFVPETFTLNQLAGTPSFVLFNASGVRLHSFFGHEKPEVLTHFIDQYITTS